MEIHEEPAEQRNRESRSVDARRRFRSASLTVCLEGLSETQDEAGAQRVPDTSGETFLVVNKAPKVEVR